MKDTFLSTYNVITTKRNSYRNIMCVLVLTFAFNSVTAIAAELVKEKTETARTDAIKKKCAVDNDYKMQAVDGCVKAAMAATSSLPTSQEKKE